MKKLNQKSQGGGIAYSAPTVQRTDVAVEKGFAQSGLDVLDPDFGWGGDINDFE